MHESPAQALQQDYRVFTDPKERERIVERAKVMIREIHDGHFGNLVFLDKSARPLATLFRQTWKETYPKESFPAVSFMNVGQELSKYGAITLLRAAGKKLTDEDDFANVLKEIPDEIVKQNIHSVDFDRAAQTYRLLLEYMRKEGVYIIDEYSLTGRSRVMAERLVDILFRAAYPGEQPSSIRSAAFSSPQNHVFNNPNMPWHQPNATGVSDHSVDFSRDLRAASSRKQHQETAKRLVGVDASDLSPETKEIVRGKFRKNLEESQKVHEDMQKIRAELKRIASESTHVGDASSKHKKTVTVPWWKQLWSHSDERPNL